MNLKKCIMELQALFKLSMFLLGALAVVGIDLFISARKKASRAKKDREKKD